MLFYIKPRPVEILNDHHDLILSEVRDFRHGHGSMQHDEFMFWYSRLSRVQIESRPIAKVLDYWDSKETIFYIEYTDDIADVLELMDRLDGAVFLAGIARDGWYTLKVGGTMLSVNARAQVMMGGT